MRIAILNSKTLQALDIDKSHPISLVELYVKSLNTDIKNLLISLDSLSQSKEDNLYKSIPDLLRKYAPYPEYINMIINGAVMLKGFSSEEEQRIREWQLTNKTDRELFSRFSNALFTYLSLLLNPENFFLDDRIMVYLDGKINYSLRIVDDVLREVFEFNDLLALLFFIYVKIIQLDITVNRCENCGDYFIPSSRSDEKYCNKVIKGRTCKDIGYYNRLQTDSSLSAMREYRKAYKTKNAYKNRNRLNRPHVEDAFKKWVYEAQRKLNDVETGTLTLDEFITWLNEPLRLEE